VPELDVPLAELPDEPELPVLPPPPPPGQLVMANSRMKSMAVRMRMVTSRNASIIKNSNG
jgi:hypothetical protein